MPLDPAAKAVLDTIAALGAPPSHTLAPEALRAGRVLPPPGPDVHRVEDLEAAGPDGPVPVRVYWPREGADLPAIVWYHGGGWVIGSVEGDDAHCRRLCNLAQCVVVSVEYRLAPEHRYPAAIDDSYAAFVWTVQNAKRLGVDPARVAIGGWSAGGNLAAVVAQMLRDRGGPTPVRQVLVVPVTDCAMDTTSYRDNDGYILSLPLMQYFWDHYCPSGIDRSQPYTSPLRAKHLGGLPPAHILTAEYDPLRDEGMAYAEALRTAGVPVEAKVYEGQIHIFLTSTHLFPAGLQALEDAAAGLRAAWASTPEGSANAGDRAGAVR